MIKAHKHPLMRIYREAAKATKLVYVAVSNRSFRYSAWGHSRIVYIGMTKVGVGRVAGSAAKKAEMIIKENNCKYLDFFAIDAKGHPGVPLWEKLERALVIRFREIMGGVPKYNISYKNAKWRDEKDYIDQDTLDGIISRFSKGSTSDPSHQSKQKRKVKRKKKRK